MSTTKKTFLLDGQLASDIKAIAIELHQSETQTISSALKLYRDDYYMKHKATLVNERIVSILQATCANMERSINQRTNAVLSELAIQSAMQNLILSNGLEIKGKDLHVYRLKALEFLKDKNRPLRLDELE
ncbi:MAG: hypothetical protein RR879_00015 [Hydrogenoanaerobacterium sp.]